MSVHARPAYTSHAWDIGHLRNPLSGFSASWFPLCNWIQRVNNNKKKWFMIYRQLCWPLHCKNFWYNVIIYPRSWQLWSQRNYPPPLAAQSNNSRNNNLTKNCLGKMPELLWLTLFKNKSFMFPMVIQAQQYVWATKEIVLLYCVH